jgi:chromosome segregation ATPase
MNAIVKPLGRDAEIAAVLAAIDNLEARTPRLRNAVERAAQAVIDNALAGAEAPTADLQKATRKAETDLAIGLEREKSILAGHRKAIDVAKAKLAELQAAQARDDAELERVRREREAAEILALMLARGAEIDTAVDTAAKSFAELRTLAVQFAGHYGDLLDRDERNVFASHMHASNLAERFKVRATFKGLPAGKTMMDTSADRPPCAADPILSIATVVALLEKHGKDG